MAADLPLVTRTCCSPGTSRGICTCSIVQSTVASSILPRTTSCSCWLCPTAMLLRREQSRMPLFSSRRPTGTWASSTCPSIPVPSWPSRSSWAGWLLSAMRSSGGGLAESVGELRLPRVRRPRSQRPLPAGHAILWVLDNRQKCGTDDCGARCGKCHPACLRCQQSRHRAVFQCHVSRRCSGGKAIKFSSPVVANGHVYVGGRGRRHTTGWHRNGRPATAPRAIADARRPARRR